MARLIDALVEFPGRDGRAAPGPASAFALRALLAVAGICAAGVLFADISMGDRVAASVMILVFAAVNGIGLRVIERSPAFVPVYLVLSAHLWVAYPVKLLITVLAPDASWLSHQFFDAAVVQSELAGAFVSATVGIAAFLAAMMIPWAAPRRAASSGSPAIRHIVFIAMIGALLALRLFNQVVLGIGIPGVEAAAFDIPFVGGVLELLSRPVVFALINLYFYSVLKSGDSRGSSCAVALMLVNVLLGLRVGYKSELVLHGLFVVYCFLSLRHRLSPSRRRATAVLAAAIVTGTVVLYPLMNQYRFLRLSGQPLGEAIRNAATLADERDSSFSIRFFNRVNGIDAYYAAVRLGQGREFTWTALLDDSVMDLIKERLYGAYKDDAVSAFGTTQFSALYLVGGLPLLALGGLVLGAGFRCTFEILGRVLRHPVSYEATLPSFCLVWVKALSAGGMMTLYAKEWILVAAVVLVADRFGFVGRDVQTGRPVDTVLSRRPAQLMQ